ncbi:ABC transporter ATP-binding protein [Rhodoligotrophos defluvii]|uniref:ABC transporter ATP-binding protein n=1 Tax=Rhodoligotrophos defluvii TaxID=2561934 RepID=UPI0010CA147E|nr:ABC transporter ATP-binding protein [Rhodoligotrophos defluvii]
MTLLSVQNVSVQYSGYGQTVHALSDISFVLEQGSTLGLVGESGCGKSTLALTILGLLPDTARAKGTVSFEGQNLLGLSEAERNKVRWRRLAYVPQSAVNSLNPVTTLFHQFRMAWRAHGGRGDGRARAEELFRRVDLDPALLSRYPHELSGGMRQRAIIALALMFNPSLLVADEPTTGLDVIVQRQVINLLRDLRAKEGMAIIFISHDIGVVAELCDRVAVMYAGEIAEIGPTAQVLSAPTHPYTMGLKQAFPDIREPEAPLVSIAGAPPRLLEVPSYCSFSDRCPFVAPICRQKKPPLAPFGPGQAATCHFGDEAPELRRRAAEPSIWEAEAA